MFQGKDLFPPVQGALSRPGFAWLAGLAVLGLVGAAQGQQMDRQPTPAAANAPQHTVSGTVINSVSGEPVPRALVSLRAPRSQYTMTDSSGRFRFEGVSEGNVIMSAQKPGFFDPAQWDPMGSPEAVVVQVGADLDNSVLKLLPQAVIVGRVNSTSGLPIEDLPVRLYTRTIEDGRRRWTAGTSTATAENGQFRFSSLMPGSYCVSVGPERRLTRPSGARPHGYPQAFYPSAPELAAAGVISLSAGQQFETAFSLNQEPLFEISGQVTGVPTSERVGVVLMSGDGGEGLSPLRFNARQGRFSGYVPAGKYVLRAFANQGNRQLTATVPLTIVANTPAIQVVVSEQISIPVNLRIESAAPERSRPKTYPANVQLQPLADSPFHYGFGSSDNGNNSGLSIPGVIPGDYTVRVTTASFYAQSITSGSLDLSREPLAVRPGTQPDTIDVVLRDDGGQVSGQVRLGDRRRAWVLLIPERGSPNDLKVIQVLGDGAFSADQIRPGDYFLLAFDRVDDLEYRNPDVLGVYLSSAVRVSVSPRQHVTANLELIPLEK